MKTSRKLQILVPVIVFALVIIACGSSSNTGEKVGEVNTSPSPTKTSTTGEKVGEVNTSPSPTKTSTSNKIFTVGDVVTVKDHNIVINSVDYTSGLIKVNFLVDNTGSTDLSVSSMISFSAKSDDGTKLEQEYFDCGASLDGSVLPGDKLRGDLCFKLPAPGLFKVYYESSLFSSGAVVWAFDTNSLPADVEPQVSESSNIANFNNIGDVIKVSDHTITLNSAEIVNNLLKLNFTIENLGSEDVNVSSMLSFTAKGPDGTKLDQEYFDCGSSFDGSVIAGDKLRGDICYKTGGVSPIKVYYEGNLFSSGAVVWIVQ